MRHLLPAALTALALIFATVPAADAAPGANDRDLADAIAKDAGISKTQAKKALTALTKAIADNLKDGKKVTIKSLGTFTVFQRKARTGKDPQTGKTINIQPGKSAKFRASKQFEKAIK